MIDLDKWFFDYYYDNDEIIYFTLGQNFYDIIRKHKAGKLSISMDVVNDACEHLMTYAHLMDYFDVIQPRIQNDPTKIAATKMFGSFIYHEMSARADVLFGSDWHV